MRNFVFIAVPCLVALAALGLWIGLGDEVPRAEPAVLLVEVDENTLMMGRALGKAVALCPLPGGGPFEVPEGVEVGRADREGWELFVTDSPARIEVGTPEGPVRLAIGPADPGQQASCQRLPDGTGPLARSGFGGPDLGRWVRKVAAPIVRWVRWVPAFL
jgi:hypothetical protein